MVPDGQAAAGAHDERRPRPRWRDERRDRDRAQEGGRGDDWDGADRGRVSSGRPARHGLGRCGTPALGAHRHAVGLEPDDHRAIEVGPEHARPGRGQPVKGRLRRMPVGIAGPGRCDRDRRAGRIDERLCGRRLAAVVGDLEQVHVRQPVLEERWVDAFLDVAHQQEAPLPDLAEQDDRDVVDAGPAIGRGGRDLATDRPQDAQRDLVDR
jgi:hypothetical protein